MIVEPLRPYSGAQRTLFSEPTEEVCARYQITEEQLAEWASRHLIRWEPGLGLDCDEDRNAQFLSRLCASDLPAPVVSELVARLPAYPALDENRVFFSVEGQWVRVRAQNPFEIVAEHMDAFLDHLMEDEEDGWVAVSDLLESCHRRLAGRIEQLEAKVREMEAEGSS